MSQRLSPAVALAVPMDQASLLPDIVAVAKGGNVQVFGKGNGFLVGIAIKFVGVPDRAVMTNEVDGVERHCHEPRLADGAIPCKTRSRVWRLFEPANVKLWREIRIIRATITA